jgi:hypothetical protein
MAGTEAEPWWVTLLREQASGDFPDMAGAEAAVTLPISDRLITRLIAQRLPQSAPIRELEVRAHQGDQISVRMRLSKPAILPPVQIRLAIEQQPQLPAAPTLVVGIVSQGLASLAVNALKFVDVLPPGISFDGRRFVIDLRTLLDRYGRGWVLAYLTDLKITTADGRIVVRAGGALPGRR